MMRKQFEFLMVILLMILTGSRVSSAQEVTNTPDAGWPVEERCVGKAIKPPEGWSYDGTILMTGYAGIHGVNAKWDTPRVLAKLGDHDLWGGAISPDGKWYASPYGEVIRTQSNNVITDVNQLHIYSLAGDGKKIIMDWPLIETYQMTHVPIYWRDNENFLYPNLETTLVINPFSKKQVAWGQSGFDGYEEYRSQFSPDWERALYTEYDGTVKSYVKRLYALPSNTLLTTKAIEVPISWMPNSSGFIATVIDNKKPIPFSHLILFDKNGEQLEEVNVSKDRQQFGETTSGWSNDSRYFAFIAFDYYRPEDGIYLQKYSKDNRLYIVDMKEHRVIDTCRAIGEGLAWSPRGDQLTFFEAGEGLKHILILDMQSYKLYSVANHIVGYDYRIYQGNDGASDRILGWRDD